MQRAEVIARLLSMVVLSTVVVYAHFWLEVRDPRMLEAVPVLRAFGAIAWVVAVICGAAYAWRRVARPGTASLLTMIVVTLVVTVAQARLPIAELVMGEFAAGVDAANEVVLVPIVLFGVLVLVSSGYFRPLTDAEAGAALDALDAEHPTIVVNDGLPLGTRVLIYDTDCAACTALMERVRATERERSLLFASVHSNFARGVSARHPKLARVTSPIVVDRDDMFGECVSTGWNARVALDIYTGGRPSRIHRELSVALPRVVLDAGYRLFGGHAHATIGGMAAPVARVRRTGRVLA